MTTTTDRIAVQTTAQVGPSIVDTDRIDGTLLEDAWTLYSNAFEELNASAVQRHLMYRDEFADVMLDKRVRKYVHHTAGVLDGLATYTNCLEAVPLISPQYFQRRWPKHYEQKRIWYVGFVAVHEDAPLMTFAELIEAMHHDSGTAAITALDVCARTIHTRHLPRAVRVLLHRLSGVAVRMERLDEQSYWLYEFTADELGDSQP